MLRRLLAPLLVSLILFTHSQLCAQPGAVEAVALGPTTVRVYWNPVEGATQYVITRDGVEIGTTGAADKQYTDTTAEPGHTYSYNVASVEAGGARKAGHPYLERSFAALPDETRCDVLVVGATTAGVAAAVTAARYGLNTVLIEETRRLGGMPVNGLGATDMRRPEHSSGFFEEFRRHVQALYGGGEGMSYEPRIAHQAIKEIVWSAPGLVVHRQVRPVAVKKRGGAVQAVIAEELPSDRRVTFYPRLVVDATDTGDMAAWAGAPFRVGREPRTRRERHAGYIFYDRAGDRALPGSTGRGDRRVQAYAYLMTVKDYGPGADWTIPNPPGYDPNNYVHAPKWEQSWAVSSGKLPNHKFEVNQHPQGSDLQVVNYPYPTASYAERRRIEQRFKDHALGYLYYIQTVEGHKNIGLSDDDYRDSDNWPQLLYIREARRFEADRVLDETDIRDSRKVALPDSVGLGDYPMDSHAVEPKTDWNRPDMGEGEFYLPGYTPWHQVPYHAMIPRRVDNVFVPTAVSATHVAYGTVRLEPVRFHFGEAAGVACYLCLRYNLTPRRVPVRQVQEELVKYSGGEGEQGRGGNKDAVTRREGDGAIPESSSTLNSGLSTPASALHAFTPSSAGTFLYYFPDVKPEMRKYRAIQWLGARGFYPSPEPAKRTVASGQMAAPFEPDGSLDVGEALRSLRILNRRAAEDAATGIWPDIARDPAVLRQAEGSALTRGLGARLLARYMGWTAPPGSDHYEDTPLGSPWHEAAEALYATWIDSRLWDPWPVHAASGKLVFAPDKPLTRAQWAQMVYFAQVHTGPLFEDHVEDLAPIPVR